MLGDSDNTEEASAAGAKRIGGDRQRVDLKQITKVCYTIVMAGSQFHSKSGVSL